MSGDDPPAASRVALFAATIVVMLLLLVDWYTTRIAPPYALPAISAVVIGYTELVRVRRRGLEQHLAERHFHRPSPRDLACAALAFVAAPVVVLAASFATSAAGLPTGSSHSGIAASNTQSPVVVAGYIVLFYLFVGPVEEYIFRHYLQRRVLGRWLGAAGRVIAASLLFAAAHLSVYGATTAGVASMTHIFAAALVFGAAYEATDNLFVPSVAHASYNSFSILLLYLL